jgi:acetylornithine/succinyldiaminopimelate/putrescine aminotransferase
VNNRNFPTLTKTIAPTGNVYGSMWTDASGRIIFDCFTDSGATPVSNHRSAGWIYRARNAGVPLRKPHAFFDYERDDVYPLRLFRQLSLGDAGRIFYSNSGSEAIETAIKLARRATGREVVAGIVGDFHGRTYGAMSLQYDDLDPSPPYHYDGYGPFVAGLYPFDEDAAIQASRQPMNNVAAVVVSPVNMNNTLEDWTRWVWEFAADARKSGALIIFDEVQTGFGRGGGLVSITESGEWREYAARVANFDPDIYDAMTRPDIFCFGKAMGGGFPMSATIAHGAIVDEAMTPGSHFNTMSGSPLGVALASYFLDWMEDDGLVSFLDWAASLEAKHPKNVLRRGGLMALAVDDPRDWAAEVFRKHGLFVAANRPNKPIRFYPSLDISESERKIIEYIFAEEFSAT